MNKVAYIAHPIGGNIEGNLKKLQKINRYININEPDVVPFIPYYADCVSLDDRVKSERNRGIKNNMFLFSLGFIDELRLYGDTISNGMLMEIKEAKKTGLKIVPMTKGTRKYLKLLK